MSGLTQIVSRALGGGRRGAARRPMGGAGTVGGGRPMGGGARPTGGRKQDEAIGRGVRSLLRRFR
jgi:hypothetical protein